ncbi:MAG: hypothetical protein JST91_02950 [Actinobacteria bacterium]|nr:hypothetical protein [Actinomycetota bacterium]
MSMTPGLEHYVAVRMTERWGGTADVRVPGGNCWHCGTAIAYCVEIQSSVTGERHEIGTTCAEKLGLDIAQIKQRMAEKRAAERWHATRRQRHEAASAAPIEQPHGTVRRFLAGCYCLPCIDVALTAKSNEYAVATKSVIIDLATGQPARATIVDTRYGQSWRIDDGTWLTAHPRPKRRSTHAAKGYVEAEVPCLIRYGWRPVRGEPARYTETMLCPLASPLHDVWGTPIRRPVEHPSGS